MSNFDKLRSRVPEVDRLCRRIDAKDFATSQEVADARHALVSEHLPRQSKILLTPPPRMPY